MLGQTSGLQGLGSKGFEMLCTGQGPACLPSHPWGWQTTGSPVIPRVKKDVLASAEATLQFSFLSLWELVGHLQKAWEEQLMKRSNSLENCLTLLLYFWMFPHGQGLLRSWFPPELSHLGIQWNLWNREELERRPAGIRECSENFLRILEVCCFKKTWDHRSGTRQA